MLGIVLHINDIYGHRLISANPNVKISLSAETREAEGVAGSFAPGSMLKPIHWLANALPTAPNQSHRRLPGAEKSRWDEQKATNSSHELDWAITLRDHRQGFSPLTTAEQTYRDT